MKCALLIPLLLATVTRIASGETRMSLPVEYTGMCDASAAVALDLNTFVVANDEDNLLRFYSRSRSGAPLSSLDIADFLNVSKGSSETDLEGATRIGNRIYWISSHASRESGKPAPDRQRFFATDVAVNGGQTSLAPAGAPCTSLLRDLIREPKLARFQLGRAADLPVKDPGALSIEGLTATPDGSLLIGFRTPNPGGNALLVPLQNPEALLEGKPASFGEPILLDLSGHGIRSIEHHEGHYLIVAGHHDNQTPSRLYRWAGPGHPPERAGGLDLSRLNPEAMVFYENTAPGEFHLISDDGGRSIGGTNCKDLKVPAQKRFRSCLTILDPPASR